MSEPPPRPCACHDVETRTQDWVASMDRAIDLAQSPDAPRSANPRVGCVILDADGVVVGEGFHRGAGSAHAEVVALQSAGSRARGGTAVVSLEPCRHVGRTGPCTKALVEAGIARVVYAQRDPTPLAGGGAEVLASAGVEVLGGVLADRAEPVNRAWTHWKKTGRPLVTAKCAMSIDGRVAGGFGEPIEITSAVAREWMHRFRSDVDAICIGTGTVRMDDPRLTARQPSGRLYPRQPIRVVVGKSDLPDSARILEPGSPTLVLQTRDLTGVLAELGDLGVQHLLVEGGPTLCTGFLDAGLVDEVLWWIAPRLLGLGPVSLGVLTSPIDVDVTAVDGIGEDVLVRGTTRVRVPARVA
jgi:diaminohydroxyphosphoribosylaminopyrimidine deaminase/5-amino-6-(5-phosphoribosylamino)uracil reductase